MVEYSYETYEKVYNQLQREAEGKKGSILDNTDERRLREQLLRENPDVRRAVQRGNEFLATARSAGYSSSAELQEGLGYAKLFGGNKGYLSFLPHKEGYSLKETPAQQLPPVKAIDFVGQPGVILRGEKEISAYEKTGKIPSYAFDSLSLNNPNARTIGDFTQAKTQEILQKDFESKIARKEFYGEGISGYSTENGTIFSFSPTKSQIKSARNQARSDFFNLPISEQGERLFYSGALGVANLGIDLIQGGIDLLPLQRTFRTEDIGMVDKGILNPLGLESPGKQFVEKFDLFQDIRGRPRDIVSGGVEVAGIIGLTVAGGGGAVSRSVSIGKAEGLSAGIKSFVTELSPLRPQAGIYTSESIQNFEGKFIDIGAEGKTRFQAFEGRSRVGEDINIKALGIGKDDFSAALTKVERGILEIRPTGDINYYKQIDIIPSFGKNIGEEFAFSGKAFRGFDNVIGEDFIVGLNFPKGRVTETRTRFDINKNIAHQLSLSVCYRNK